MDFLLILLAVGGLVVAVVMLVLASRATRMQADSDARVETLQSMATTGSVLFAATPARQTDEDLDLSLYELPDEDAMDASGREDIVAAPAAARVIEPVRRPVPAIDATPLPPRHPEPASYVRPAAAFPFVMNVPAAAGAGRVQISFDRTRNRSGS